MSVFSPSGSSAVSGGSGTLVSTPSIANQTLALANTEYSYVLPGSTKFFRLKNRDDGLTKLAFVSGGTTTAYITVYPGETYESPPFGIDASITIYFQSKKVSVIEIESWV